MVKLPITMECLELSSSYFLKFVKCSSNREGFGLSCHKRLYQGKRKLLIDLLRLIDLEQ